MESCAIKCICWKSFSPIYKSPRSRRSITKKTLKMIIAHLFLEFASDTSSLTHDTWLSRWAGLFRTYITLLILNGAYLSSTFISSSCWQVEIVVPAHPREWGMKHPRRGRWQSVTNRIIGWNSCSQCHLIKVFTSLTSQYCYLSRIVYY